MNALRFRTVTAAIAEKRLKALAEPRRAAVVAGYFKTGPGQYGEGDKFLGLTVPQLRGLVKEFHGLPVDECVKLLQSEFHELRLFALLLMVDAYKRGDDATKAKLFRTYIANTKRINNWDLVDVSAEHIVGAQLLDRDHALLTRFAKSKLLWERRMAIIATLYYIRRNEFTYTFKIAELLMEDREDLIHKAVGWMLREVGNRDRAAEERFLKKHYQHMPRTMLRYAIEKFEPARRKAYLQGEV
jgi:3-methyladenine DNA glycosylase AlkD